LPEFIKSILIRINNTKLALKALKSAI